MTHKLNVFGKPLTPCSMNPLTGFYRDGCCSTGEEDLGMHTVCIRANWEFLEFSKRKGNDLSTPRPEYQFAGVRPGDQWCLCAMRWKEAWEAGCAPAVILEATNQDVLKYIPFEVLLEFKVESMEAGG
ncbi:MAG: DUF2237 domain-containing protein [Saprospiraceae bacterium]|nr:DUF2237 domain-containing protein [Saprospiraceae bacterium]HRG69453.1 DUF2237 domain-containing protein [Saprospiraceae bacterium]